MENTATRLRAIANDMRDTPNEQTMREIASRSELLVMRADRPEIGE
jgi:hypothetical protein